jgi:GNAT superfamily N-acetyltransferase
MRHVMPQAEFIAASPLTHRDTLIELNVEYLTWVFASVEAQFGIPADQVNGMPASAYVPTVIDHVCGHTPPHGIFYLVKVNNQWAGMGGLRCLSPGVADIKRFYVRPVCRGMGLGARLLNHLLADARSFGRERVYLDTAPFMTAARHIYRANGFADCAPYVGTEVPAALHDRWHFMSRAV